MPVITISREFGSEGSAIAADVARALGYHYADKHTIETMLKDYGLVEFDEEYRSIPGFWDRFDAHKMERRRTLISMLNQSILALAHHGNIVIVGRGGFSVLKDFADVLHVRIQAPLTLRIRRATELPEIAEPSRAEILVKDNDRLQKTFIESVYGADWDSAKAFDLVIDTGKIPPAAAAAWLVGAAKSLVVSKQSGVHTTSELKIDRILDSTVIDVLNCRTSHAG